MHQVAYIYVHVSGQTNLKCTADSEDYSNRSALVWGLLYWFTPQLVGACLDEFKQESNY